MYYQPDPSMARWQEAGVTSTRVVCTQAGCGLYTFSGHVCVADGSEQTLVGLFEANHTQEVL